MNRNTVKEVAFWILCIVTAATVIACELYQSQQAAQIDATTARIEDRFTVHERTPTPLSIPAPTYQQSN